MMFARYACCYCETTPSGNSDEVFFMKLKSKLMTTEEIMRVLKRIAHQITEKNNGVDNVVVFGIAKGGVPIAKQLTSYLESIEETQVPCFTIDITRYRDDLSGNGKDKSIGESKDNKSPIDINGKRVILVDDVLFTGRTVRAALDAISDYGRAGSIQLAVLVDRGHRELPIRPDYVGKNVPTSLGETVKIEFDEHSAMPMVNLYAI